MSIRFHEDDIRTTGRVSMGVIGMRFADEEDEVIAMQILNQGENLLVVSEYGMGKMTPISEFRIQGRGGKGILCYKTNEKTGKLVAAKLCNEGTDILIITNHGQMIRTPIEGISVIGRNTSGVKIMNVDRADGEYVASIAKARREENEDASEDEDENVSDDIKVEESSEDEEN